MGAAVTVRRRVLGSLAAFLLAVAAVGSVQAQPPFNPNFPLPPGGGREVTTDEVKARIEWLLTRGKGGPPTVPPGMDPFKLLEQLKALGFDPGKNAKLTPEQIEGLKKWAEQNPEYKRRIEEMRKEGKIPPLPPDFGKGDPPPIPPDFGKGFPSKNDPFKLPDNFKVAPPEKGQPRKDFPPQPPDPLRPGPKDQKPPFNDALPPPVGPLQPPRDPKDIPPWEQPESPQEKARQAAAALWEKNVGPLDETPAVKKALFDIAEGTTDLTDPDGNNLWQTLAKEFGDGKSLGDLLDGVDTGGGWKMPDWEFPKLHWNWNWGSSKAPDLGAENLGPTKENWFSRLFRRNTTTSSSSSSSPSSWFSGWKMPRWNVGVPAIDGTIIPFLLLIAAVVGGVLLWRWLAKRQPDPFKVDPYALGPWPVDPFRLASRQDVVVAFEHLSVLICGPVAKTWTHTTIAGALAELAMAEPGRAMMLARLYELARYTPVDEPLTTAELAEARRLVTRLAGFSDD
jgi:hypothetical protein